MYTAKIKSDAANTSITYDPVANATYTYLREGKIVKTVQISEKEFHDFDEEGNLLGIERLF